MRNRLLLSLLIFASLGIFLIGLPSVAKETNQKPPASKDVKKQVEEAKPDNRLECTGMKAPRPASENCLR